MFRQPLRWLFLCSVLCSLVVCTCIGLVYGNQLRRSDSLVIFGWPNLFDPSVLKSFEDLYNCKLIYSIFDSNEAMYAKIRSGGSNSYDIIVGTSYIAEIMQEDGWLAKIDKQQIPNLSYVDRQLLSFSIDRDIIYSVPFFVDLSVIAYNSNRVPYVPDSWSVFSSWETLRKRMTILDDPLEVIGAALLCLGYDNNELSHKGLEEAKKLILSSKKNIATFSSEVGLGLESEEFLVSHAYLCEVLRQLNPGSPISFAIPKEGAIISFDNLLILQNSKKKELAHALINFLLEPENAAKNSVFNCGYPSNVGAQKILPSELSDIFNKYYGDLLKKNSPHIIRWHKDREKLIFPIWDEIKSS